MSTVCRIRAVSGICSPLSPSGYPDPSSFSWWWRITGNTWRKDFKGEQIRSPTTGCCFMMTHSWSVRGPGLARTGSGTAIFADVVDDSGRCSATRNSSRSPRRSAMATEYFDKRSQCPRCKDLCFDTQCQAEQDSFGLSNSSVNSFKRRSECTRARSSCLFTGLLRKSSAPHIILECDHPCLSASYQHDGDQSRLRLGLDFQADSKPVLPGIITSSKASHDPSWKARSARSPSSAQMML